jgi:hypothetical protein
MPDFVGTTPKKSQAVRRGYSPKTESATKVMLAPNATTVAQIGVT